MPKVNKPLGVFIGIDPGVNGGIAVISNGNLAELSPMPETEKDCWDYIIEQREYHFTTTACIEWIHPAIFQIGKAPMSKLYGSYMALRMCLTAAGIPFEEAKPVDWQRAMKLPNRKKTWDTYKWKKVLRGKAQQLYPKASITMETADAVLIATYHYRKTKGTL